MSVDPSVEDIDGWLPQTQCTRCGYPRCLAYAMALRDGRADINQCPPGGPPRKGFDQALNVLPNGRFIVQVKRRGIRSLDFFDLCLSEGKRFASRSGRAHIDQSGVLVVIANEAPV